MGVFVSFELGVCSLHKIVVDDNHRQNENRDEYHSLNGVSRFTGNSSESAGIFALVDVLGTLIAHITSPFEKSTAILDIIIIA